MPQTTTPPRPCPRCGASLEPSGVVTGPGGESCPVYQCESCTSDWPFGGDVFRVAYTFAVMPDGSVFDPNALDDPQAN